MKGRVLGEGAAFTCGNSVALIEILIDVIDRLLNRGDFFCFFVRDFRFEFFFQRHHEFDGIQRVGAKVVDERRLIGNFLLFDPQLFDNNLFYTFLNATHFLTFLPSQLRPFSRGGC